MKKRRIQSERHENPWASKLRRISDNIHKRKFHKALAESNSLLASGDITNLQKSRVLALVGDSEFKRGRFAKSAEIQLEALAINLDHPTLWLRPYIGGVRALLKVPQVDQAIVLARQAVAMAETKMAGFDSQVRHANHGLSARKTVAVSPVPVRISVVATRMGNLFLQEGEPEAAAELFQKAIQSAQGGANRARQGLAIIALAQGAFEEAEKISAEAIRIGHYRAKTLPAWALHISARRKQGCWRINDRLIKGLEKAPAGLRARTILAIVTELRRNGMRQWRPVAEDWMSKEGGSFSPHVIDIRKMILASAKIDGADPAVTRTAAEQLLRMNELGLRDWLSAAKEYVRAGMLMGNIVHPEHLLLEARNRFGRDAIPLVAHRLALSCLLVKQEEAARSLLQSSISGAKAGSTQWAKSLWALARLEKGLNHHLAAARAYKQLFETQGLPTRFRLQAQLHWVEEMMAAGDADAFWDAHALMAETLKKVQDPEVLLNFARQLLFGPPELKEWGREIYLQGAALAIAQFDAATHPSTAIHILFKLTRRQVIDFDRSADAIRIWEDMSYNKRDWLWSGSSLFWEYLGCLVTAYLRVQDFAAAEDFANGFLDDPASPASGLPYLGVPFAKHLLVHDRKEDGLALCERMAQGAPRHPACAWAWYWLALQSWVGGKIEPAKDYARRIQLAQGLQPGTLDGQRLDVRARLLRVDLNTSQLDLRSVEYAASFIAEQLAQIENDLRRLQQ